MQMKHQQQQQHHCHWGLFPWKSTPCVKPRQRWTDGELSSSAAPPLAYIDGLTHTHTQTRVCVHTDTDPAQSPSSPRQPPKSEIKGWICKANGCGAAARDGERGRRGTVRKRAKQTGSSSAKGGGRGRATKAQRRKNVLQIKQQNCPSDCRVWTVQAI